MRAEVGVIDRRGFLAGAVIGAAGVGAAELGVTSWRRAQNLHSRESYSQMGEDLVLHDLLHEGMKIPRPTYLDIGAADPVQASNTYLLHQGGGHGVLVEPNPAFQTRLRRYRPNDVIVEAGVGITDDGSADYYVIRDAPMRNTFSKDDVEYLRKRAGRDAVVAPEHHGDGPLVLARERRRAERLAHGRDLEDVPLRGIARQPRLLDGRPDVTLVGDAEAEARDLLVDARDAKRGRPHVDAAPPGAEVERNAKDVHGRHDAHRTQLLAYLTGSAKITLNIVAPRIS
jgi:hypothetical protein